MRRAAEIASLPGLAVAVSVFVDTVEESLAAVAAGATDLLLRDWDTARIGALRDALAPRALVERTALPPGITIDEHYEKVDAVSVDRKVLSRALINLIENALSARAMKSAASSPRERVASRSTQQRHPIRLPPSRSNLLRTIACRPASSRVPRSPARDWTPRLHIRRRSTHRP